MIVANVLITSPVKFVTTPVPIFKAFVNKPFKRFVKNNVNC